MQSLSLTHVWQVSRLASVVSVQVRVLGLQLVPPQSASSVPGVHFSELVPETAKRLDKLAVIRSMSTKDENHSTGVPRVQRGDPKNRGVTYPFLGSALAKLRPPENDLPPYVWIKPGRGGFIWQDAGFLGAK